MSDRVKRSLVAFVEALLGPRIDRCALYPGRIVTVSGVELDVQLDDERWPTMTRVPLRPPFPGATVEPVTGSRVLVGWEEADATKPYALPVWGPSAPATNVAIEVETAFKLGDGSSEATKARTLAQHLSAISKDLEIIATAAGAVAANYGATAKAALDETAPIAAKKVLIE